LVGEPVWRLWVEANAPFLFTVVPLLGAAAVVVVGALGRETGHSATQSGKVG
jgi:hypothetical protein